MQIKDQESGKIRIASCQFPVSSEIRENFNRIKDQMIEEKMRQADIVHFPECALSGYPAPESWPCYFITPDGLVQNKLTSNLPGILISDIDISKNYYDASKPYKLDAINGKLNSGECVDDTRSANRNSR